MLQRQLTFDEIAEGDHHPTVFGTAPGAVANDGGAERVVRTAALDEIDFLDRELSSRFRQVFRVDPSLTRQIVSFQANKSTPRYRWYKYKEAFSANLVEYLLIRGGLNSGKVLDPFAGLGTTLFAARSLGLDADGIELLPVGHQLMTTRLRLEAEIRESHLAALAMWASQRPWNTCRPEWALPQLRITDGAYPQETVDAVSRFMTFSAGQDEVMQAALQFALLCILESISYTRKDGQYLRWDHRSGRRQGSRPFDKGPILAFDEAISSKIREIVADLGTAQGTGLFTRRVAPGAIRVLSGSCLDILPALPNSSYDAIVTSPPYCNRYDYTRTYALELALLGTGEKEMTSLRQRMLTCTVENRQKDLDRTNPGWTRALDAADNQVLLQTIIRYLEEEKEADHLNNGGIPRMVRGYFYEMACVAVECARVLRPGAPLFMVNDNVRYAGASISVDMILSSVAQKLGFLVEEILVLPQGKGNSSQQMGSHGRDALRKCVYVWRKA